MKLPWAACLTTCILAACGGGGDSGADEPAPDGGDGGVVDPGAKEVSGRFYLGGTEHPAVGFEVWIVDRTERTYRVLMTGDDGAVSVPVEEFAESHVYSLHLVREFRLIGDLDMSRGLSGTQAALMFHGGYGFDFGDVVLPVDGHGLIDTAGGDPEGSVGGGFSIVDETDGGLAAFPLADFVSRAAIGSQLVVMDPVVVLEGFLRRDVNPLYYSRVLAEHSRIGLELQAAESPGISQIRAAEGAQWLQAARLVESDPDAAPGGGGFWSDRKFEVAPADDGSYRIEMHTGSRPLPGDVLVVRALPLAGESQSLPLVLGPVMTLPPVVTAVAATGGQPATVDYDSATAENGLSRPFCQSGAVTLRLSPPADTAGGDLWLSPGTIIDIEIDYFGRAAGSARLLEVTPDQFAAPWNEARSEALSTGVVRVWDPTTRRLRHIYSDPEGDPAPSLSVPVELLPSGLGGAGVFNIRFRIHYRRTIGPEDGGTALWFAKDC